MSEHAELPWYSVANSWQYATIYDVNGDPVCRLDLEDWGVTEANQDALEKVQAEVVQRIVLAANHHHALVKALESISSYDDCHAGNIARAALAALKEASNERP